jgi:hypothetical protein
MASCPADTAIKNEKAKDKPYNLQSNIFVPNANCARLKTKKVKKLLPLQKELPVNPKTYVDLDLTLIVILFEDPYNPE